MYTCPDQYRQFIRVGKKASPTNNPSNKALPNEHDEDDAGEI
jgi:hypothetical protein